MYKITLLLLASIFISSPAVCESFAKVSATGVTPDEYGTAVTSLLSVDFSKLGIENNATYYDPKTKVFSLEAYGEKPESGLASVVLALPAGVRSKFSGIKVIDQKEAKIKPANKRRCANPGVPTKECG